MCIYQTSSDGKTQVSHEAVHVQLSADAAVVSVCAEKIREYERRWQLEQARADTAEARVKDLEIRLKDAMVERPSRETVGMGAIHPDPGMHRIH